MPGQVILTEAVFAELLEAVKHGVPVKTACAASGATREAFYRLLERDPSARAAYEQARAEWEAELVQAIHQTAMDSTSRDSFKAKAFMLTHHPSTRETYREERRSIVEHEHPDNAALAQLHSVVRALSDDELLALAGGDEPEASSESEANEPGLDR